MNCIIVIGFIFYTSHFGRAVDMLEIVIIAHSDRRSFNEIHRVQNTI